MLNGPQYSQQPHRPNNKPGAQFRYISAQVKAHQDTTDPVVRVNTKNKELVGAPSPRLPGWRAV